LEKVQAIIAIEASKNLKNTNYQFYIQLGLVYFRNDKSSFYRRCFMETIFKYFQPRSEYLEGYKFFSEICNQLNNKFFYVEMAFALFFAYQLKMFDNVKNILNIHFLKFDFNNYDSLKYYCMYFFYQGQYFISIKVLLFLINILTSK